MSRIFALVVLALSAAPVVGQSRNCLRVMPVEELTRNSALVARVKVHKADKANYRGSYSQIATLRIIDVVEGDFTIKELHVLARSNVQCAEDNYIAGQEMLVFLQPVDSLFRTSNLQFGQFLIVGEIVKGWRDKNNRPVDRSYQEVRREIEEYTHALHVRPPESPTQPPAPANPPPPGS